MEEIVGPGNVLHFLHSSTYLSAKLGNRLYGGRLAEGRRPLEGSVTTLVGVEEVDDVTGVAPATEGRDGDPGADTLWTGFILTPGIQKPFKRLFDCPTCIHIRPSISPVSVEVHPHEPTLC